MSSSPGMKTNLGKKNLIPTFLGLAFTFVGTILGAGFASGREIWQFFGVFGSRGWIGVVIFALVFTSIGLATAYIANKIGSDDFGRIILPFRSHVGEKITAGFISLILFSALITMTAAGGALLHQELGFNRMVGGIIILLGVLATVIGGFERVSRVFKYIMPLLIVIILVTCTIIINKTFPSTHGGIRIEPSPLAPIWYVSALLYASYNLMAMVPMVATATVKIGDKKSAYGGAIAGSMFLAILVMVTTISLGKDPGFTHSMEMPMIAYASRLNPVIYGIYIFVLMFAIFGSATGNFYCFTLWFKDDIWKKKKIILSGCMAFGLGLIGFKNVVAYMFPIVGMGGAIIMVLLVINFFVVKYMVKDDRAEYGLFKNFPDHDRLDFPGPIERVTAGWGGEALLIVGSEKTALYDCGMAYAGEEMVANLKEILGERTLDYVVISHTHYDHVGALPSIRTAFPCVEVWSSAHGKKILDREGAKNTIKELGIEAELIYGVGDKEKIKTEGLYADRVLEDQGRIDLGDLTLVGYETKGHTDCTMAVLIEPDMILIAGESTGILEAEEKMHTAVLKSYRDSLESSIKCQNLGAKWIISPHYGVIPQTYNQRYWELFREALAEEMSFLKDLKSQNLGEEEMLNRYKDRYWEEDRKSEQPLEAFLINGRCSIRAYEKELEKN